MTSEIAKMMMKVTNLKVNTSRSLKSSASRHYPGKPMHQDRRQLCCRMLHVKEDLICSCFCFLPRNIHNCLPESKAKRKARSTLQTQRLHHDASASGVDSTRAYPGSPKGDLKAGVLPALATPLLSVSAGIRVHRTQTCK